MVDAVTRWPSLSSSPWILLYPQPLFWVAIRSISAATSVLAGGRPYGTDRSTCGRSGGGASAGRCRG
jgi:hypothetical protein